MPELSEDYILTVRDLIINNWNSTNVSSLPIGTTSGTIRVHTGWFNHSWNQPQIGVVNPTEFPLSGGTTGFIATDAGGAGGVKFMIADMNVACWAHNEDNTNINPLLLRFQMSEEVKRIIKNNTFPGNDIEWLSWLGRTGFVDTDAEPVLFRYDNQVRLMYCDRV